MNARRGLRWPSREAAAVYFGYGLVIDVVFIAVFGGAGWLAVVRGGGYRLYMDWELSIPFVSAMIWAYCSMWVLCLVPLFQLDAPALRRLGMRVIGATLAAGFVFVVLPADVGFPRPDSLTGQAWLDDLIFRYNSAPSLHVIFSGLIVLALTESAPRWLCILYWGWLLVIAVSTVLTHQHHVVDVLSAAVFVIVAHRAVPARSHSLSHSPTH